MRPAFDPVRSSLLGARADHVYEWFEKAVHLPGDVAECGVYLGETARELARYLRAHAIAKTVHLFDSFEGLPDVVTDEEKRLSVWPELGKGHYAATHDAVARTMSGLDHQLHPGLFSETLPRFERRLCFIHSDGDLYESTVDVIRFSDRVLVPGGIVVFDDYGNPRLPGVRLAVERFLDPGKYRIVPSSDSIQCFAVRATPDSIA